MNDIRQCSDCLMDVDCDLFEDNNGFCNSCFGFGEDVDNKLNLVRCTQCNHECEAEEVIKAKVREDDYIDLCPSCGSPESMEKMR
jgi:hypothetical protein